ncbi:amidohydrolase family protein [Chloroflexota bacterium]
MNAINKNKFRQDIRNVAIIAHVDHGKITFREDHSMIIDAHTHMVHKDFFPAMAKTGGDWGKKITDLALERSKKTPNLVDVKLRVEQLDRNNIDQQVVTPRRTFDSNLLPGDVPAQLEYAKVLNESMGRLGEDSGGRLIATGNTPLAEYEKYGRKETERAVNSLGIKAIVISSNFRGKPIDLPEYEPFWAHMAEIGLPVYIHPDNPASTDGRTYEGDYDLAHCFGWPFDSELMLARLVFSGLMEKYPTLKIVSHHLGGGIPFFWGRVEETYEDQKRKLGRELPKPLYDYFKLFYYDTAIGGNVAAIRCACEVFGTDQVIFATDAPFGPKAGEHRMAEYPKAIEALGLPEAEKQNIFANNISRVLNLA